MSGLFLSLILCFAMINLESEEPEHLSWQLGEPDNIPETEIINIDEPEPVRQNYDRWAE